MDYLLHDLLVHSAKQYPEKMAVICDEEQITYGDLHKLSSKLATVLIENEVNCGDRVGIFLPKSIQSIIGIHGVLKAGATYVPLDLKAPNSRLAFVIRNCDIKCLLVTSQEIKALEGMFPAAPPFKVIVVLRGVAAKEFACSAKVIHWNDVLDKNEAAQQDRRVSQNDLAYILYTSGSTGVPKGVMISHLNSLFFVSWAYEAMQVGPNDRFANHAPLHFDLSIFDIFVCFKSGATLILVPDMISIFPTQLAKWIDENQVTVWYSVPSVLTMLVSQGRLSILKFSKLRYVIFAGEVFPVKYLRELMTLIPHAEFYNLYGPTETNVITYYKTKSIPREQIKPVPIGKACAGLKLWIEMEDGNAATSVGQKGELFAQGPCVAQGYWGDEEKTRQSFIKKNPSSEVQDNIYKTGDLVTIDEDGNYIYLGRRDNMIKSRGYRIELGEIEAVLYSHPKVNELAVVAVPDDLIGNRIKSFVVLNNEQTVSAQELRMYCATRIPQYMVPEVIEFRKNLPKTSTGKVDKKRLLDESG